MACVNGIVSLVNNRGIMSGYDPLGVSNVIRFPGADGDPIPAPLTVLAGGAEQRNNLIYAVGAAPSDTNGHIIAAETDHTDGIVSATYNARGGSGDESGVAFRIVDHRNFYDLVILSGGSLQMIAVIDGGFDHGGTFQILATHTIPSYSNTQDYEIGVRMEGDNLTMILDGTDIATVTNDTFNTATMHGLKFGGTNTGFDNLRLPFAA